MEALVLIGSFFVFILFGYYLMGKLDQFLGHIQPCEDPQSHPLKIAVSNPYAAAPVLRALESLQAQCADIEFQVAIGQEAEIVECLKAGSIDVAVVSCGVPDSKTAHCVRFTFFPDALFVGGAGIALFPMDWEEQCQKVLWRKLQTPAPVQKFVQQLCKQCGRAVL